MRALYADNAVIRDVMSITDLKDTRNPDEEMEMLKDFYAEYEIVEFSWFNSTQGTLDYCKNYTLDADYLIAKDEESDRGIIPNLYGPELINMEFVTSEYCDQ